MKKLVLIALLVSFASNLYSQVEITPTFGYTISGKVKAVDGDINVEGAASYGGIIGVEIIEHSFIEFTYRRSTPTVVYQPYNSNEDGRQGTSGIEQYNLGFAQEFEISNDQVLPFANFTMGSTRYTLQDGATNYDSWLFSMSFGGGIKYFFTDNIGLRLQTNLVLPSAFGGNNIYCGWYGCYPVSTYYIPLVHWDNSLGIIFKF